MESDTPSPELQRELQRFQNIAESAGLDPAAAMESARPIADMAIATMMESGVAVLDALAGEVTEIMQRHVGPACAEVLELIELRRDEMRKALDAKVPARSSAKGPDSETLR